MYEMMTTAAPANATGSFPENLFEAMIESVPNAFNFLDELQLDTNETMEGGTDGLFAVMSFIGDINWSYTLLMPRPTTEAMVLKFAGFEIPYDTPDIGDIVGELANVLAGEVVAQCDRRGVCVQMSLPTVARGTDLEVFMPEGNPAKRIRYTSKQGMFGFKLMKAKPTAQWHHRMGLNGEGDKK
jgi:chemotaxis protein CheX